MERLVLFRRDSFLNEPRKDITHKTPLKLASLVLVVILVFFVIIWVRAFYGARENYHKGEAFLKGGHTIRAVTFFDRSIHWYTPLNPYVEKSAEQLWEIGEGAQREGDKRLALIAFETIRSGFYGASHLVTPGKEWIQKVDAKLHELGAAPKNIMDPHPDVFWSVVVVTSFLAWVGSVFAFIVFVLGRKKTARTLVNRPVLWVGLASIFFFLWIVGMYKA
jgi:hypothetical protein